jgi:peptidoglycan/LPS O-acetylase OafA/YrhL
LNYWFAVIIYCVAHEKLFVRFLGWAPLQYLGKISYGLYIYHFPIVYFFPVNWFVAQIQEAGISEGLIPLLILIFAFTATLTVASVSYYLLEKPFLKIKDRFASYAG